MRVRALGLLSGGLDSTLAARLLIDQGVEVEGIYFSTGFCVVENRARAPRKADLDKSFRNEARRAGRDLDVPVHIVPVGEEYLDIIRRPGHGRGSAFNPCIDCRIFMFRRAADFMKENGFHFLFTGEVVGQRPMTQMRNTQKMIARISGLGDTILRPLSARLLPPTLPEREGWVDREQLLDIHGRGRGRQLEMAERFGIRDFPAPAGGCCFLTDPNLAPRFRALFDSRDPSDVSLEDLLLVRFGRHFILPGGSRLIVGREEAENVHLEQFARGRILLDATEAPGPIGLYEGDAQDDDFALALRIVARYCSPAAGDTPRVLVTTPGGEPILRTADRLTVEETENLIVQ